MASEEASVNWVANVAEGIKRRSVERTLGLLIMPLMAASG